MSASFREQVRDRQRLTGTFFKTASYQAVEVLAGSGLDFIVLDAEHAPFDRNQLDVCLMAARAGGLPALVRIPDDTPRSVLDVLDMGATGLLVPHARSAADAQRVRAAARYRGGVRGFSNSPRAGGYGRTPMLAHVEASDRESVVVCQIEDREAVDAIDAIAAVNEVDCLFIGRADLAVSYDVWDINHPTISDAVERICQGCKRAGKAVGIFLSDTRELPQFLALGVSLFVIGSDQSLLRAQAASLAGQVRNAQPAQPGHAGRSEGGA